MSKSVLIVGSSELESLESSYARAYRQLGWEVGFWNPDLALKRNVRGKAVGEIVSKYFHVESWFRKANLELLQLVGQVHPRLILVIGTRGLRAGTLAQIRARYPGIIVYCLYPDSPHSLDAERINCLPFFDRVTVSAPAWVKYFEQFGAKCVHYLPFAGDTELHRPCQPYETPTSLPAHDVVFIGTWRPDREAILEQLADFDLCLWGSQYWKTRTRRNSPLKSRWGGHSITGKEFSEVCSRSKILLNIIDDLTWPGPNMRAFEQPACRAFSLTTRTPAILDMFKEGNTIECFSTITELREKIFYYLDHEAERLRVADASYQFIVQDGNTYINRAQMVIKWVNEDRINQ